MRNKSITHILSIFLFVFLLGVFGCTGSDDCCTIIDVDVQVHYQNESGENLLDSNEDYKASAIKIYYKNGDDYDYVYNRDLSHPNMHFVYEDEQGRLLLRVFPSYNYEGDRSTTLIQLNEQNVDTLLCEFDLENGNEICTKAWLNGIEMPNRFINMKE